MRISAKLCFLSVAMILQQASASQAPSVSDQILTDYRNSKSYAEFVTKLSEAALPGDRAYVRELWKSFPELGQNKALPKLIFEDKQFVVREGMTEIKLTSSEASPYEFTLNGEKLFYTKYDSATERLAKISALTKARKSVHFVFLPVVWAAEQGQANRLDVLLLELTSALSNSRASGMDTDVADFRALNQALQEARTASKSKISESCQTKIGEIERLLQYELAPSSQWSCAGSALTFSFAGLDSKGASYQLDVEKTSFKVHVNGTAGSQEFSFKNTPVDEEARSVVEGDGGAKGSPYQRSLNYTPVSAKDRAGLDYRDRFVAIAADNRVQDFCGSCQNDLKVYNSLVKTLSAKLNQAQKLKPSGKSSKGQN